jgi:hypothetical protein
MSPISVSIDLTTLKIFYDLQAAHYEAHCAFYLQTSVLSSPFLSAVFSSTLEVRLESYWRGLFRRKEDGYLIQ